ncbi:MAG: helix-turn-helix transcriptional regulator [Anaerolineaceae bacterium]|nr:helix-turn-helix transcriptional regulator [Anaerolineaceae bacterium]
MPKGIPLTEEEIRRRRREVFRAALPVMTQKGFSATSMREIADAAGIGKSTLYDYFRTKDEVLLFAIEEAMDSMYSGALEIRNRPLPAIEKLYAIMKQELDTILQNKEFFMQIMVEAQKLGMHSQQRIIQMRYTYQDLIRSVIEQGVTEGSFRKVNSLLVARILIGAMSHVVYATRPTGSPEEMLNEVFDLIFVGVMVPGEAGLAALQARLEDAA